MGVKTQHHARAGAMVMPDLGKPGASESRRAGCWLQPVTRVAVFPEDQAEHHCLSLPAPSGQRDSFLLYLGVLEGKTQGGDLCTNEPHPSGPQLGRGMGGLEL